MKDRAWWSLSTQPRRVLSHVRLTGVRASRAKWEMQFAATVPVRRSSRLCGIHDMVLLSNSRHAPVGLSGYGLAIVEERPITVQA